MFGIEAIKPAQIKRNYFLTVERGMVRILLFLCLFVAWSGFAVGAEEQPIDKFRSGLEAQDAALKAMNIRMYDSVELVAPKTAKVTVTEQWMKIITPKDNTGNIPTMFNSWRFSHSPSATGVKLIVVAPDGAIIREMNN